MSLGRIDALLEALNELVEGATKVDLGPGGLLSEHPDFGKVIAELLNAQVRYEAARFTGKVPAEEAERALGKAWRKAQAQEKTCGLSNKLNQIVRDLLSANKARPGKFHFDRRGTITFQAGGSA